MKTKTFVDRAALFASWLCLAKCFRRLPEKFLISPLVVAEGWVLGCRVWAKAFTFFFSQVRLGGFLSERAKVKRMRQSKALWLVGIFQKHHWEEGR